MPVLCRVPDLIKRICLSCAVRVLCRAMSVLSRALLIERASKDEIQVNLMLRTAGSFRFPYCVTR